MTADPNQPAPAQGAKGSRTAQSTPPGQAAAKRAAGRSSRSAPRSPAKGPAKGAAKAPAKKATEKPQKAVKTATSKAAKKAPEKPAKKAVKKTAARTTPAASTPAASAPAVSTAAARPVRGAFAAGAARASGERRRRAGTPLIPTEPVEVSAARRLAAGTSMQTTPSDEIATATDASVSQAPTTEAPVTPRAGDGAVEDTKAVEDTTATDAPEAPHDPPAPERPSGARTRPSRASMRSTRRPSSGEPKRLRAVPPVEEVELPDEPVSANPATRHTAPGDGEGWEQALTSGLQSRAEKLIGSVLEGAEFSSESRPGPAELVELAVNVLRAAATSAGVPAEDVERQIAETLAYVRRRLTGDYVVDEFGFDEDYTINVHLPLLRPLYKKWFRVEVRGIENIPDVGGALVVGNHSGTVAMDSLMTQVAVYDEHPRNRHLRMLGADLVFQMPFIGTMARRSGTTLAANTDAERLLSTGSLVGVWPEGFKGVGKPFSERYKLQRFGRGGFVSAALRAGVPIVPVSIVGAEEIYPIIGNMPAVARLLGLPYAPITPTFPLLGPLGMVPLPSKWLIEFGPPIQTTSFGPDAADDPMLVFDLTDQVRETIQQTLYSLLMQRKSVFV